MIFENFGHVIIGETVWDYDYNSPILLASPRNKIVKHFGNNFDKAISKILQKEFVND